MFLFLYDLCMYTYIILHFVFFSFYFFKKFIIFYIKVSSIHFLFGQKNGENAAGRGKITKNSKITLEKGFLLCYNVDTLRKGALSCYPFQGGSWLKRRQKEVVQASSKALKQALSIPAREAIL